VRLIVICGLYGSTVFFPLISQKARFLKKKKKGIEHKMCFDFLKKKQMILRTIRRDISEGRWFDSRWCHWNFSLP
jgi:hypothetical protein